MKTTKMLLMPLAALLVAGTLFAAADDHNMGDMNVPTNVPQPAPSPPTEVPGVAEWKEACVEDGPITIKGAPPGKGHWVRYGADGKWAYKILPNGQHKCDNATFTDPIVGTLKKGYTMQLNFATAKKPPCWIYGPNSVTESFDWVDEQKAADGSIASPAGQYAVWRCETPYGYTKGHYLVGIREELIPKLPSLAAIFGRGTDAQKESFYRDSLGCVPDGSATPCAKYEVLTRAAQTRLGFSNGAVELKAINWAVAKNGTTTTRPMYPVLPNGKRGTTAAKAPVRAQVDAPCGCMSGDDTIRAIVEGKNTYCPIGGTGTIEASLVTLCTLRP